MEFTKSFLKHMEILQKANKFYDTDLKKRVMNKMYELDEKATDEQFDLIGAMEDTTDDEEYWNCIHALANSLSI